MDDQSPALGDPPWLTAARAELGVRELPGAHTSPRIALYFSATTYPATMDETPWCAAFVNWCLQRAGISGTRRANARSFLQWGTPLMLPRPGAVMVYESPTRGPSAGHVAFFLRPHDPKSARWLRAEHVLDDVLGGNQLNSVCVQPYPRARLIGMRWPAGFEWPPR